MSGFYQALPHILKYEGGYVNDPDDPGGATNKGITQAVYDAWRRSEGLTTQSVRQIRDEEVEAIYFHRYWLDGKCDALPWPCSFAHFDACVNTGIRQATKFVQRACMAAGQELPQWGDDGMWGDETKAAVARTDPRLLLAEMLMERLRFYDLLAQRRAPLRKFFRGWTNRVLKLREAVR